MDAKFTGTKCHITCVAGNRSLDEFASDPSPDADSSDDSASTSEPVTPIASTTVWSPTGSACDSCGTVVERRWRDDDRLVCADCKSW